MDWGEDYWDGASPDPDSGVDKAADRIDREVIMRDGLPWIVRNPISDVVMTRETYQHARDLATVWATDNPGVDILIYKPSYCVCAPVGSPVLEPVAEDTI